MRTIIKVFTPELAGKIIEERNPYNYRNISMETVAIFANDMKNGNWKENGECIKFDTNGNLIDGQHRLMAVIQSGIPIEFVVVLDLDTSVADTIDIGRKRSIEQYLKWADKGYKSGATAIVHQVMTFRRGLKQTGQSAQNSRISLMDTMDEYRKDASGYNEAALKGKEINAQCKVIKPKEAGSIFYFLTKDMGWSKEIVERFFWDLYTVKANDKTLYGLTMNDLSKAKGKARIDLYIHCFNSMVNGCKVQRRNYSDFFLRPESVKPMAKIRVEESVSI